MAGFPIRDRVEEFSLFRKYVDGINYHEQSTGLIIATMFLYLAVFLGGAISIMVVSTNNVFPDGTVKTVDFTSAVTASIANLGNIGPAVEIGNINAGPAGNYFAYSEFAKIIMSCLMLIGRVGIVTILMLFITRSGISSVKESVEEYHFDGDEAYLRS